MTEGTRVRIAPSPTGPIHIGNVRTALFNYLFARNTGGSFVLRLEDTDVERSETRWEHVIYEELQWLGLEWDEGPDKGGPFGPYRQTERLELYRRRAEQLWNEEHVYPCFCTPEELERERQAAAERDEVYHYSGSCRNLAPERRRELLDTETPHVLRLRVDPERTVEVEDAVHGSVAFPGKDIGDFVIMRSNGVPVYNFAVVVDDLAMEITHVLRANDHLTNTAAQVLLYEALEEDPPKFAHVGLVLGEDRSKLSKRTGDAFVGDFRKKGYLPEALFNFLALLGWTPEGEEELFSKEELIRQFSLERLANHPAVFDMDKLNWMNAQYIRQLTEEQLLERALPFLEEAGLVELPVGEERREWLAAVVGLIQDEVTYLAEVPELAEVFFDFTEVGYTEEARRALGQEHVPMLLQEFAKKIQSAEELDRAAAQRIFRELRDETELGGRKVFMPIRAALTGTCHGPELYSLIPLLGEDCIFNRVDEARDSS